jgi:hypothetical protein
MYRLGDLDPGQYVVGVLSVQSTVLATTPESPAHLAIGELEAGAIMAGRPAHVEGPTIDVDGTHRLAITSFATPPPPGSSGARAYPPTFYPNAESVSAADPIEIGYGDDKDGLEIQLRPVRAVRVSGTLDGAEGAALASSLLRLMPAGDESLGAGSEAATTVVERDGSFTFLNVPSGQYTLMAQPAIVDFSTSDYGTRIPDPVGYSGNLVGVGSWEGVPGLQVMERGGVPKPWWARASLTVGIEDIPNLVVPLRQSAVIRGHLVYPDSMKKPPATLEYPTRATPASGDPSLGEAVGHVKDGEFVIEGCLTGTYFLDAGSNVSSVIVAGQDVRDTGIDVSSGADVNDVIVTLTDKLATVSGSVRDTGATSQAAVLLFPADRAAWTNYGWHPLRIITTLTDVKGGFQLGRVVAGDYLVVAVDLSKGAAWTDPAFLQAAASLATPISVKWDEKKNVNLTVATVTVK